jgi:hypothetical protein
MKKIIRLTESDLTRIVKRVIAEGAGKGNVLWVIDEQDMVEGKFYDEVENLMGGYGKTNKKELYGKWKMRVIDGTCFLDYYVNNREVFSDTFGPISDILPTFKDIRSGNFKITTTMYNHPEAGPTPKYEIQILK